MSIETLGIAAQTMRTMDEYLKGQENGLGFIPSEEMVGHSLYNARLEAQSIARSKGLEREQVEQVDQWLMAMFNANQWGHFLPAGAWQRHPSWLVAEATKNVKDAEGQLIYRQNLLSERTKQYDKRLYEQRNAETQS